MTYLWQNADWPSFNWSNSALLEKLVKARFEQGRLLSLPSDFVHSYEVSEIKKHIYSDLVNTGLNLERLHGWQASLFPTGFSGIKKIKIADFRTHDISRSSLPSKRISDSVQQYLHWWHEPPVELDPVLRSAISFFWFYSISPFDDGNFDLACALSELSLQNIEKTKSRNYDISLQLEENRDDVLARIEKTLLGNADITDWLLYYLDLFIVAVDSAYSIADKNYSIDLFWKRFAQLDLNQRQRKVINHLLDHSLDTVNNRSYVQIAKTTRESAKRDLTDLSNSGLLIRDGTIGRSVYYKLGSVL
jgi:Fic family protein